MFQCHKCRIFLKYYFKNYLQIAKSMIYQENFCKNNRSKKVVYNSKNIKPVTWKVEQRIREQVYKHMEKTYVL